ncbi:hypothetical protein GGQ80_003638 [Sphingomonas jinjuensis]|uniref:Glycosyltransferase RgtA/B/C/D-like domain-containing protein n=1 Tax=Sphingomonas jinjuensis TaxID=535907 RepID=A0A840F915_9SPHN|nr:hypothetical protein [Sphingomonas jinjuensis]MBB4155713.1 hypothetical protein [Sphingomonas jinjuensis]
MRPLPTIRPAWRWPLVAVAALAVALATRWPLIGSPFAGLDEQFYLLAGDRLLHGALPYVDVWDRKPFGLFLLYAAMRQLPGDGILAYQLVSTAFVALAGILTVAVARRGAGWTASLAAGGVVIGGSTFLGVGLGEAPVFYDPLVIAAAWLILARRGGGWAMLLMGIAITIKTTAVFEGIAFGVLLLLTHRERGFPALVGRAARYALIGAAPTLAIAGFYASQGDFAAFWFANVTSILRRQGGTSDASLIQLVASLLLVAPLALPAVIGWRRARDRMLLGAWSMAAGLGFLAVGYFAFHYALPLLAPLAILAAQGLPRRAAPIAATLVASLLGWQAVQASPTEQDRSDLARLLKALPADVATHCLLVREGPAILYHAAHACLASPYAFPGHFAAAGEARALGRPRAAILDDALARRPAAIVDRAWPADATRLRALGYRPSGPFTMRLYGATRVPLIVWRRGSDG